MICLQEWQACRLVAKIHIPRYISSSQEVQYDNEYRFVPFFSRKSHGLADPRMSVAQGREASHIFIQDWSFIPSMSRYPYIRHVFCFAGS